MALSVLEYWNGSAWVVESNLLRFTIKDKLQEPMELDALIANFSSSGLNTKETNYGKFTKVRLKERFSNKYIFYGKILRTHPSRDSQYGHVVEIRALDNLRELATKTVDADITNQTTRSGLISQIITNNTWATGSLYNIAVDDSTKFKTSTVSESSGVLNKTYTGDRKKLLDIIQSIAAEDPITTGFGYDFYLDTEFNGNTPTPDLFYYPRGTIPSGTMPASGLTIEYNGTEADQVIVMAGDYSFARQATELKTRAVVRWVDDEDKPRKTDSILINHGATSGGDFEIGNTITWSGSGSAKVLLVGNTNRWLVIGPDSVNVDDVEINSNWLKPVSGLSISGSGHSATVASATANPPGSLREAIESESEVIIQSYDISSEKAAAVRAAGALYSSGDTVTRGMINVYKFPQYTIKGTHTGSNGASSLTDSSKTFTDLGIFKGDVVKNTTDVSQAPITSVSGTNIVGTLVNGTENDWDNGDNYEIPIPIRAGHIIFVKGIPSDSNIGNQSVLVTQVEYNEGPGLQITTLHVALHSEGRTSIPRSPARKNEDNTNIAADVPSNDQSGIKTRSSLGWTSTILFSPDGTNGHNTVDWSSGSIFFFDGTDFSISAGTTGAISAVTYIYFNKDSPTILQSTTNANTAKGPNNIVLATCENVASGGTVTIETTTGVAQKNYYSMDALFDGAQYGRIQAGNLLSGWLNLGAANNAGVLDLDKTAESSTKKHVTGDQRDGGGRAFAGLTSTGFLTREHILNDVGLSFRSSSGSAYIGITGSGILGYGGGANQFQIQATNGAAGFGGQVSGVYKVIANSDGLTLGTGTTGGGSGTGFLNFKGETSGYGIYKVTNYNGILQLFAGQLATLRPGGSSGSWSLGDSSLAWGSIWNVNYKVFRSSGVYSSLTSNSGGDLLWNGSSISGGVTAHDQLTGLSGQDHSAYSLTSHGHINVYAPYAHITDANAHHTPTTNTWRPATNTSSSSTTTGLSAYGLQLHEATTHGGGGGSGTINSGTTSRFAYYSGSTTLDASLGSSAFLYASGYYVTGTGIYLPGISSGSGVDLILQSSTVKTDSSSRRYKENIVGLAVDTSKVYDLVPKTFKWKDFEEPVIDENGITDEIVTVIGKTDFGLIAEEVHEVLPELVIYNKANEPDAVRYKTITVLLIEEMKKLKARIEVLEGV